MTVDPADTATTAVAELRAQRDAAQGDLAESEAERAADERNNDATVAGLEATIADLRAQLKPWQPFHTYDLTRDEGWQINTGARPTVDSSTGQKAMVNFGPDGLRLSAQPAGTKIASCDVIAKFVPLPTYRAVEMDVQFSGPLGSGMFPAPYWTKTIENGGGEFDGVEYMGALAGTKDDAYSWKMTAIGLPATTPLKQVQKPLKPFFAANNLDPTAKHTWRWEHTNGKVELLIDGASAATITRGDYDTKYGVGAWDKQFENPAYHWYIRHTWQVGPRGDGKTGGMGGAVPAEWAGTSFLISRLVVEVPRGTA
jgi:hypothetical protein